MFDLVVMFLCVALVVGALVVAKGKTKNALAALGSLGAVFFLLRRSLPTKAKTPRPSSAPPLPTPQDVQHERDAAVKAYRKRVEALTDVTHGPDPSEALAARMGRYRPTEIHGDLGDEGDQ